MLPKFPDLSLSLEQEFDLRKFQDLMKDLSRIELEDLLLMVLRQKMTHENISRSLIQEIVRQDAVNLLSSLKLV